MKPSNNGKKSPETGKGGNLYQKEKTPTVSQIAARTNTFFIIICKDCKTGRCDLLMSHKFQLPHIPVLSIRT